MIESLLLLLIFSITMIIKQYCVFAINQESQETVIHIVRGNDIVYEICDGWENHPKIIDEIVDDYSLQIRLVEKVSSFHKMIAVITTIQRYLIISSVCYFLFFSLFVILHFVFDNNDILTINFASETSFALFLISTIISPAIDMIIPYAISKKHESKMKGIHEQKKFQEILRLNSKVIELREIRSTKITSSQKVDDMLKSLFPNDPNITKNKNENKKD